MKFAKILLIFAFLGITTSVLADEGMWFVGNLSKQTQQKMKQRGA